MLEALAKTLVRTKGPEPDFWLSITKLLSMLQSQLGTDVGQRCVRLEPVHLSRDSRTRFYLNSILSQSSLILEI